MYVCINGRFISLDQAKVSVFDHGFLYGDGVYDTTRTYHGIIWKPFEHLVRLRKSAEALSISYPWLDQEIVSWMNALVAKNAFQESRIRIMMTRGMNKFIFSQVIEPTCVILGEELQEEPASVFEDGVFAITVSFERQLPSIKTISSLPMIFARLTMESAGAYEVFFVDRDGNVTEGSITNVFIVKDGVLKTTHRNILSGIAREVILDSASGICVVQLTDIPLTDLYAADECFITNSLKGIVPVVKIDQKHIGVAVVGKITRKLMDKFKTML